MHSIMGVNNNEIKHEILMHKEANKQIGSGSVEEMGTLFYCLMDPTTQYTSDQVHYLEESSSQMTIKHSWGLKFMIVSLQSRPLFSASCLGVLITDSEIGSQLHFSSPAKLGPQISYVVYIVNT
ncbi:hypothetical protein RYX36_002938 [Vicia faba]